MVLGAKNVAQTMPFCGDKHTVHPNKQVTWTEKATHSELEHIFLTTMVHLSSTKIPTSQLALEGCYESVDCSTGMEYWNGILERNFVCISGHVIPVYALVVHVTNRLLGCQSLP